MLSKGILELLAIPNVLWKKVAQVPSPSWELPGTKPKLLIAIAINRNTAFVITRVLVRL